MKGDINKYKNRRKIYSSGPKHRVNSTAKKKKIEKKKTSELASLLLRRTLHGDVMT